MFYLGKMSNSDDIQQQIKILRIIFVIFCYCIIPSKDGICKSVASDPTLFFNTSRFEFFENDLTIKVKLQKQEIINSYLGVILGIESSDNIQRNVTLNWEKDIIGQIIVTSGYKIFKHNFTPETHLFETNEEIIEIHIDFKKDILTVSASKNNFVFDNVGFSVSNGYKFLLIPQRYPGMNGADVMTVINKEVTTGSVKSGKYPNWYWYVIIVVVDLLIFLGVHLSRKHKKKVVQLTTSPSCDSLFDVTLPTKSAIYIFGTLLVYDKSGEDITKKFSPLIKELLSILIIYSKEKGVTSEQLKEMLWYDKSDSSARNNRAVNIGKLRALLDTVGDYEITNNNGIWFLVPRDIFIDYYEYERVISEPQPLTKSNLSLLLALSRGGVLLVSSDYEWIDNYKSKVSDNLIDILIKYSHSLNSSNDADLLIKIADAIMKYDPVNEVALSIKCRTFTETNKTYMAKAAYEKYCKEYKMLYNEDYETTFADVLNILHPKQ